MPKTSRGQSALRGVRRGNDIYLGWKVTTPTASREGEVFSRKNKLEQIQHTHKKKMTHRPVHSPVPRYARTEYPGRPWLWAEKDASRDKLNNDGKNIGVLPELLPGTEPRVRQGKRK